MGLFGKLKDAVGIGSLKAEIQLNAPGYNPGDTLSGAVVLHGAASDTTVTSVLLQLANIGTDIETTEVITEDYWYGTSWETHDRKFKYNTVLFEMYLAQNFVVTNGQRLELPFDITTPPDLLATDKHNTYVLKTHVDLPGKVDCRAARAVHILVGAVGAAMDPTMDPAMMGPTMDEGGGDLPSPGERILGYYEDAWYECTVVQVGPQGVQVNWDDGAASMVTLDQILPSESAIPQPSDLAVGQRVMARYGEGFYEATIGAVSMQQVGIQWDDGAESWVELSDVRLL